MAQYDTDAVVIGAGPNGLAAAATLAEAGCKVTVYEAGPTVGGGARTAELTLPGFHHDVCSAVHPMGLYSPVFDAMPLDQYGLEWIQPDIPLAHPLDGGRAAALYRSLDETAAGLGADENAYRRIMGPLVNQWETIAKTVLAPFSIPRNPFVAGYFGVQALMPATWYGNAFLKTEAGRGLFGGIAAHSVLPLSYPASTAFGLVLGILGHVVGWPVAKGGSQAIVDAVAAHFQALGGEIVLNHPVQSLDELPKARAYLFNTSPSQMLDISGDRLPQSFHRHLRRYRHGPGVFKVDWALDAPVPWENDACRRAGTIHIGPTLADIAASEKAMWNGQHSDKPYVLLAQQSLFDATRAPDGNHTLWGYCHVPSGSTVDMTDAIENQIERFAPGFKKHIIARHTYNTEQYQQYNMNYIGGDISGGVLDLRQLFTRPSVRLRPYNTPAKDIFICSSSTPPGGAVHGLPGYYGAKEALKRL